LRQPAHALGMFVARLAELPNDPQTRHLVACMGASVRAMQDMLDGFFDISRLDDETTPIKIVACPLEPIFEQLHNSFTRAAEEKGLRLRFRRSSAWVHSEPGLLQRILLNLVSNALRYTPQGSILVACRPTRDGGHVRIEVWDSGIGIAEKHHEDIYNEFFQIGNPERDRAKGLGVGLSIVDRACRQLGHPLTLRSSLGKGTRFSLRVPLAPDQVHDWPRVTSLAPTWSDLDGLHILFIEDDTLGREGLAGLLTSWGCQVTVATSANTACYLVRRNPSINLIISDFRLGGDTNGIEAVRQVRAVVGQSIVACLVTGDTDASVKDQAQEAELFFLQKPVRPAKLRSLLRNLMQLATAQKVSVNGSSDRPHGDPISQVDTKIS
ncbi:MAG: hybrid sensor histidine kinase/response regulator, partial [Rhodoferax sp.]|nr:hybrid sensor histidine kinase/response regulator [Rhodoferax sp.]